MRNYRALYIIAGLLLCRTSAEMMSEGKTYSQKLIKMDELGKNDQVFVKRSGTDEIAGQYFCFNGIGTISFCVNCFKNQSGYLVLYNSSNLYRYDAYLNGLNLMYLNGSPLQNFTLVEDVSSTPTTTAVPDETHIPSVTQNEPQNTTKIPEEPSTKAWSTGAKVGLAVGIIALVVVIALVIDRTNARRAGRDAITTKTFKSLQRKFCNRQPNQQAENPRERNPFMPNPNEV